MMSREMKGFSLVIALMSLALGCVSQDHNGSRGAAGGEVGFVQGDRLESIAAGVTFHERVIDSSVSGKQFLLMETEVTQRLYQAVMGENPSYFNGVREGLEQDYYYGFDLQRPVEWVSWEDGVRFANALSTAMGLRPAYDGDDNNALLIEGANGFRYPLEAEWVRAARCGEYHHKYAGSDNLDDVAWWDGNSSVQTHPVGLKQANACGLKDMTGNVWEWAADDYWNPGQHSPGADDRPQLGGGWRSSPDRCSVLISRTNEYPDTSSIHVGLRLLRPLD